MSPPSALPEKICVTCGRRFAWRARWRRNWDEVRYCSRACRGGPDPTSLALEVEIRTIAASQAAGATFCPSLAVRRVYGQTDGWPKDAMEKAREAARRLIAAGELEMLQRQQVVDPSTARGPIRLRRRT